jgi:hypothetical protein
MSETALIHTVDDRKAMRVTVNMLTALIPMTGAHKNVKDGFARTCEALIQALDKIDELEAALALAKATP